MTHEFILVQKAKSKGGDKYTCISDPTFSIYFPQSVSRIGDQVHPKLMIKISPIVLKTPVTSQIEEDE
jgi:hypothetical protein